MACPLCLPVARALPPARRYPSVFAALPVVVPGLLRNGRAEAVTLRVSPRVLSGRLASLAALICSGVLTSGSDSLTLLLARATSRLWRFASRLSILYTTPERTLAGTGGALLIPIRQSDIV